MLPPGPLEPQKIGHGVDAQKSQQEDVYQTDKQIAHYRVKFVDRPINSSSEHDPGNRADQEGEGQLDRDIAQFAVHRGPHNSLGEDMEEIGANGENPFNPALIKAGVMINPPPAPMQPVIRPAHMPMKMVMIKMEVE